MNVSLTLDRLHRKATENCWMWVFYVFCRYSLAFGFIVAGIVKITDERFASGLSAKHPMGAYLEALHRTGYYYWFIGVAQISASIFLLIPRTVTLGAFIYLPIILNILILTYATRFDGSLFTAPLMTLANLYVLGWNYEKWKNVLPFNYPEHGAILQNTVEREIQENIGWKVIFQKGIRVFYSGIRAFLKRLFSDKFPKLFFAGVFASVVICVIGIPGLYSIKPRNTFVQCQKQFKDSNRKTAGETFCNCIHTNGDSLNKCMNEFFKSSDDSVGINQNL